MEILSERLLLIAKQVNHNDVICDIGTDHALIPIYLARGNLITKAYACDIAEQPLEQAKKNITKYKVGEVITPVLADGLTGVKGIAIDSCIISGLGSNTILIILEQDADNINRYILCPNDDANLIRQWVKTHRYFLEQELIMKENDLIYEILVINKSAGKKVKNQKDIMLGPILRKEKSAIFKEKWLLKVVYFQSLLEKVPAKSAKSKELTQKIKLINKVI